MTDTIEAVARAMAVSDTTEPDWGEMTSFDMSYWLDQARAALQALHANVTEEMADAGEKAALDQLLVDPEPMATCIFKAMLTEAMKEA